MAAGDDPIPDVYAEFGQLITYLDEQRQVSSSSFLDSHFRKTLVLSVASYFEKEVARVLLEFTDGRTSSCTELVAIMQSKVIERHYHSLFNWDGANANSFFSAFGEDFKKKAAEEVRKDAELAEAIRAFLQIGRLRNLLVHENYAMFPMETSSLDIYQLYEKAKRFISFLELRLPAKK